MPGLASLRPWRPGGGLPADPERRAARPVPRKGRGSIDPQDGRPVTLSDDRATELDPDAYLDLLVAAISSRCLPFRSPGSRHTGHLAAGPGPQPQPPAPAPQPQPPAPDRNRNDGTLMLLSRAWQPQRWPMDVVAAATMAHRCGCAPSRSSIAGHRCGELGRNDARLAGAAGQFAAAAAARLPWLRADAGELPVLRVARAAAASRIGAWPPHRTAVEVAADSPDCQVSIATAALSTDS